MALSLEHLYKETKTRFSLRLLTEDIPLYRSVSWIYLMEDITNCSFLRGEELVITTGLNIHDEQSLMDFVKQVYEHKACGIIFNVGNYLNEIPDHIVNWCQEKSFPVFTMPWEMYISDLTQFFCNCIVQDNNEQSLRSNYLNSIFQNAPLDLDLTIPSGYIVAYTDSTVPLYSYWATTFFEGVHYAITVGEPQIISSEVKCIGISYPFEEARESLLTAKNEALKALKYAKHFHKTIGKTSELGLYELALSIEDPHVISRYVHLLDPITDPMTRKVLRSYLEGGASVKKVSEELYIHRNTVNYHIQKAKLLLGQIDGIHACNYLISFYFSDMES